MLYDNTEFTALFFVLYIRSASNFSFKALLGFFVKIFDNGSVFLFTGSLLKRFYTYGRTYWATSSFGTYRVLSDDSRTKISELLLTSNNVVRDILEHRVSWLLCPVLAGLGMTFLTWYMIYTDSCIPGVKPPTPFSPTKNRYVYLRGEFP
jgi:hypothetical protein